VAQKRRQTHVVVGYVKCRMCNVFRLIIIGGTATGQ